jgi:feruloyl esterase
MKIWAWLAAIVLLTVPGMAHAASAGPAALPLLKPALACTALKDVDLTDIGGPGSKVTAATETSDGAAVICTVEGNLAPTIGFKVTLPAHGWNQRYLQVGCGGLCGRISLNVGAADGCAPLGAGSFALASTDMGHQGGGGEFGADPQKRSDFAHRAVHLTSVAAKKLIRAFYGQPAAFSYFSGCSDGGREALMEAQRYPEDFNGIIAGAPAMIFQVQNSLHHAWLARSNTGSDGKPIITADRLGLIHKAVLAQCDGLDGQKDDLISEPRLCQVNEKPLICKDNPTQKGTDCLSTIEAAALRALYDGPRDPTSGERLLPGSPQPGSELAWAGVFVPRDASQSPFSERIALDAIRNLVFEQNPPASFSLADFSFDKATLEKLRALHPLYDATNPDLSGLQKAGGKLILWHGWADEHISPLNTIAYHEAVQAQMGKDKAAGFERLYLLPGVRHCGNGEGPSHIDLLTPIMAWVEGGQAPDMILARQQPLDKKMAQQGRGFGAAEAPRGMAPGGAGGPPPGGPPPGGAGGPPPGMGPMMAAGPVIERTRPLFPYPEIARYDGKGDPNKPESYQRAPALFTGTALAWAGSDFFKPYSFKQ